MILPLMYRLSSYRISLYGPAARNARHVGAPDAPGRLPARLRNRQKHSQHLKRGPRYRVRLALSGIEAARSERVDRLRLGGVREQSPRQVLQAHRDRPEAPGTRTIEVD